MQRVVNQTIHPWNGTHGDTSSFFFFLVFVSVFLFLFLFSNWRNVMRNHESYDVWIRNDLANEMGVGRAYCI